MMKRRILALAAAACLMTAASASASVKVAAATYPLYDIAKNVIGDAGEVVYTQDTAEDYDLILTFGEVTADNGFNALECVENAIEGDTDITTTPINCALVAFDLADVLAAADADNAELYSDNMSAYCEELFALDLEFEDAVTEDTVIRCEDGSMAYFAAEYGVNIDDSAEITLSAYTSPSGEDQQVPYIELMRRNLAALKGE